MPDRPDALSAPAVAELLIEPPLEVDWFRLPERTANGMKLLTRSKANTTLGEVEFKVESRGGQRGTLSAWLKNANVTRTLAHLLAEYGDCDDFLQVAGSIGPFDFFRGTARPLGRSLGSGGDNWLPDANLVHRHLGPDPFSAFLPVYVDQLQRFIGTMLAPTSHAPHVWDGTDIVVRDADVACRWQWAEVRVPQIESYFERHHARAIGAVQAAATVALTVLDRADARRYDAMESDFIERAGDCLSIGIDLNDRYRMKVYAKSRSRIRFEVVRLGKGNYAGLPRPTGPRSWLLAIMEMERAHLIHVARWPNVGNFFDEHPTPQTDDLARLCSRIAEVCVRHGVLIEPTLARLLEDGGGCINSQSGLPAPLLHDLVRVGVLERHVIRRQDHRLPEKRYALTPAYRHLAQIIRTALSDPA